MGDVSSGNSFLGSPSSSSPPFVGNGLAVVPVRHLSAQSVLEGFYGNLIKSPVTTFISEQFCWIHDQTGLSWTATIVFASFAIRFCGTLPAHATSRKVGAKRAILYQSLSQVYMPKLKEAVNTIKQKRGWTEQQAKDLFHKKQPQFIQMEVERRNCAKSKLYLPFLIQIPFWVTTSVALRNLSTMQNAAFFSDPSQMAAAKARFVQMSNEGLAWFPDLTLPDSTWIIPVSLGVVLLANHELTVNQVSKDILTQGGKKPVPKITRAVDILVRSVALVMVPVSACVPTALALYWTTSATAGLVVNLVLMSPKVRDTFKIPRLPSDSKTPYKTTLINFTAKIQNGAQQSKKMGKKLKKVLKI